MSAFTDNRRRPGKRQIPGSVETRVSRRDGRGGFRMEGKRDSTARDGGLYGTNSSAKSPHVRLFKSEKSITCQANSRQGRKSKAPARGVSSTFGVLGTAQDQPSIHVVCAISENLAKETCVASLDASSPVSLHVVKQGNGQTYAETLAYLNILQPDEILLNEGRRNSQLAQKVLTQFSLSSQQEMSSLSGLNGRARKTQARNSLEKKGPPKAVRRTSNVELHGACETSTVVKFVPRPFFDQTKGADLLRRIARADSYDASIVEEYILLSSSHAVLQYTQLCLGANFSKNCIHLSINAGGKNRMAIDRSSLLHLELLGNSKTGKSKNSLIGTIDCTKTTVGGRLLRSNLMAPPTDINTINTRLDLVEAFISDEEFFYKVMDQLEALPDVNRMLAGIALMPWKKGTNDETSRITPGIASKGISALVCIKSILSLLPSLAKGLEDHLMVLDGREKSLRQAESGENGCKNDDMCTITNKSSLQVGLGGSNDPSDGRHGREFKSHHLLRAIIFVMQQPELKLILDAVNDIFTESTSFASKPDAMRHQECFALKPKTDGMLDVMRTTFLANVDDIYRLADEYAEKYDISVAVKHSTQRGYFLAIPVTTGVELPEVMVQPVKCGRNIHCTTEEVHSLNARAQDNIQDLLLLTHEHVQKVIDFARDKYDAIACLSDAIALLDLCHSFADNVASSRLPWTRPVVNKGNDLTIRNGRYGIDVPSGLSPQLGTDSIAEQHVPNHTYAPGHRNFVVITGANGSGKSTYLKQLGIICVLAHCGSFVPAEKAIVPVRDRLCTRIGITDDQEHNFSTFLMEMKEVAFICQNAGPKSLVLIDELGRATSNEDGVAIAWSVSEYLRSQRVTTFFVTHYPMLTKLAGVYPGVWNQHMGATIVQDGSVILYSHKIQNGPCQLSSDYGVEIAAACGWPSEVVADAKEIRKEIETKLPDFTAPIVVARKESEDTRRERNALLELCQQLKEVSLPSDEHNLRSKLGDIRDVLITHGGMNALGLLRRTLGKIKADVRESTGDIIPGCGENQTSEKSMVTEAKGFSGCDSSLTSLSSSESKLFLDPR